jgi:hypothetical protein
LDAYLDPDTHPDEHPDPYEYPYADQLTDSYADQNAYSDVDLDSDRDADANPNDERGGRSWYGVVLQRRTSRSVGGRRHAERLRQHGNPDGLLRGV